MSRGKRVRGGEVVRRRRTPRLDVVSALAVVIPLATVGVLALVQQPPVRQTNSPPAFTRLNDATVVCPAPGPASPAGAVSTASGASGELNVRAGVDRTAVAVSTGAVTRISGEGAAVVRGTGDVAPGLLALRFGTAPLTAQDCGVPSSGQWFVGMGAGPTHDSVVELVNPDSGRADAEITLYGERPFTNRHLHGITIPAHKTVRLDLGKLVPRRVLLSAQVQVTRGRLAVHVLDSRTDLLHHTVARDWVPSQDGPSLDNQLLGLPAGEGTRMLQILNPGEDVVSAQVEIITHDTTYAPAGMGPVTISPGSTTSVSLTTVLDKALRDGAVGVRVTADSPVVASVLTDLGSDQAVTPSDSVVRDEAATLLPVSTGQKSVPVKATLYLSAGSAGAATVAAYDTSGAKLLGQRVDQQQGHTVAVALPEGTAFLRVVPSGSEIRGAVLLTGDGASVLSLHELLTHGLVPRIRPGLD